MSYLSPKERKKEAELLLLLLLLLLLHSYGALLLLLLLLHSYGALLLLLLHSYGALLLLLLVWSTKPCHDFTGSAAATSLCCLTFESPSNSEAETEISYMVPQPPFCRFFVVFFVAAEREREKENEKEERKRGGSRVGSKATAFLQGEKACLSPSLSPPRIFNKILTLVSLTETSLRPGRALLSMASSSASEGCCGGGEVEVEKDGDGDDGDG